MLKDFSFVLFALLFIWTDLVWAASNLEESANASSDRTIAIWSSAEWSIRNPEFEGNPFDIVARVTFRHDDSSEVRTTELFYTDQEKWCYRFTGTRPGRWSFTTQCDGRDGTSRDPELHGLTGTVIVLEESEGQGRGFVTHFQNKWGWSGSQEVFIPQYVMGKDLDAYYDRKTKRVDEAKIDRDIKEFIFEHGFTGFHLQGRGRWFNLTGKPGKDPNPDPRAYEVVEAIIRKVYAVGGACHIWMWGADGNKGGEGPRWLIDGLMSKADKRNLRYLAARLGPIPGWTMGYGFDTENLWASPQELDTWKKFIEEHMGWDHLLGSRVGFDEKGPWGRYGKGIAKAPLNVKYNAPIGDQYCSWLGGDYIGYTSYRPLYDRYIQVMAHQPGRPPFEEDRFRLRKAKKWTHKDYSQELTLKGLWHSTMAGGVANIWGNLLPNSDQGGSRSYDHGSINIKHLIKTYATFFRDKKRFRREFIIDNALADPYEGTTEEPDPTSISVCLRNPSRTQFIFYKEDTSSVGMDLSRMQEPLPAVAVDTKKTYQEGSLGILHPYKHNWQAPYKSDWAIAVGRYYVLSLSGEVTVRCEAEDTAVGLAVEDLLTDLERVLGKRAKLVKMTETADIVVKIDPKLIGPERWIRDVSTDSITIIGSDALGAIYGVYEFCRTELDVDPLWFWKDLPPQRRKSIALTAGRTESTEPIFRYRGWFVNDEDLLTEWKDPSGRRFIRYPFYQQVISLEVADRIFEALLRLGGNLVIPASFVDVMNPPEAELVRRAAERGLYVTQHHIEPLGVSHFGFENYWQRKGQKKSFNYGSEPDSIRQVWKAYTEKWIELAGDRVIWQLGVRGKGDTAIWNSDKSVVRADAGRTISRAIAEQWEIVRNTDPRLEPQATTTLWMEGSQLMSEGSITFPKGVAVIFADEGATQHMQSDFYNTPRESDRMYGLYYHVGFWSRGPHLLQGTTPQRVKKVFDHVIDKGDTYYSIINVCNIREHVLGIEAAMTAMRWPWKPEVFLKDWSPPCLHESYRLLMDSFIPIEGERLLQDGAVFLVIRRHLTALAEGKPHPVGLPISAFDEAIAKLDHIITGYPTDKIPERLREFYDVHLLTQTKMWRALLQCIRSLKLTSKDAAHIAKAEIAIEEFLAVRKRASQGRWENWYRGDKKVNTPSILRLTRSVRSGPNGSRSQQ